MFSKNKWQSIIDKAPNNWGRDKTWKHNLLALIKPYAMQQVMSDIGELKPDIEMLVPGEGVIYQSISFKMFGRSTSGKLAGKPVYKQMTIRNYNTATKLLPLLQN